MAAALVAGFLAFTLLFFAARGFAALFLFFVGARFFMEADRTAPIRAGSTVSCGTPQHGPGRISMRIHGRVSAVVAAIPQDSNVDRPVFGPPTFKDVGFDTSVLFGGKAGIFFDTPVLGGNVGLELEVYQEPASRAPVP